MLRQEAGRITDWLSHVDSFPQGCKVQVIWVYITALRAFSTIAQERLVLAPVIPFQQQPVMDVYIDRMVYISLATDGLDRWVIHCVRERN